MPQVTRSTVKPVGKSEAQIVVADPIKVDLLSGPEERAWGFNDIHCLIVGEPGSGKTTLGAQEEGVLSLSFDPVNPSYDSFLAQRYIPNWDTLVAYLTGFEKIVKSGKEFPWTRIQIDGCGAMAMECQRSVQKKYGVTHVRHVGYAEGFDVMNFGFADVVNRFMALPCGMWFIAHVKDKEIQTRDGRKLERASPEIKGQMEGILVSRCHLVVNIEYLPGGSKSRIATIRGDESTVAKCNMDSRFLTSASPYPQLSGGRQVQEIVLGSSGPKDAWLKFQRAFNNQQQWANYDEMKKIVEIQKQRKEAKAQQQT